MGQNLCHKVSDDDEQIGAEKRGKYSIVPGGCQSLGRAFPFLEALCYNVKLGYVPREVSIVLRDAAVLTAVDLLRVVASTTPLRVLLQEAGAMLLRRLRVDCHTMPESHLSGIFFSRASGA